MTSSPSGTSAASGSGEAGQTWKRRSARHTFASTVLVLEALVVTFATLGAYGLRAAPAAVVWSVGGGLALVTMLLPATLRRPGGYLAGTVVQGLVLAGGVVLLAAPVDAGGFLAGTTLAVGAIFAALWVVALRLGGRIDREKAEWDAAHPDG